MFFLLSACLWSLVLGMRAEARGSQLEPTASGLGGLEGEISVGRWGKPDQRMGYGRINLYNPRAHSVEATVLVETPTFPNSNTVSTTTAPGVGQLPSHTGDTYQITLPPGSRRSLMVYHGPARYGEQEEGPLVRAWVTVKEAGEESGANREKHDHPPSGEPVWWPLEPRDLTKEQAQAPPPWAEAALVVVGDSRSFSRDQLTGLFPHGADGRPLQLIPVERAWLPWRWMPLRGLAGVVVTREQAEPMGLGGFIDGTGAGSPTEPATPSARGHLPTPEGQAVLQYVAAGGTLVILGSRAGHPPRVEEELAPSSSQATRLPYGLGLIYLTPLTAATSESGGGTGAGYSFAPIHLSKYPVAPRRSGMLTTMTIPTMGRGYPFGALLLGGVVMVLGLLAIGWSGGRAWSIWIGVLISAVVLPLVVAGVIKAGQGAAPALEPVESASYLCQGPQGLFYYSEAGFVAPITGELVLPREPPSPRAHHLHQSLSVTRLGGAAPRAGGREGGGLQIKGVDYSGEPGELVLVPGRRGPAPVRAADETPGPEGGQGSLSHQATLELEQGPRVGAGWGELLRLKVEGFAPGPDHLPRWLQQDWQGFSAGEEGEVPPCSR